MKLRDVLVEMPLMVPQSDYPFSRESEARLQLRLPSDAKEVHREGRFRLFELDEDRLYLLDGNEAVGLMSLTGPVNIDVDIPAWQVFNVYIKPEYRNQKLGLMMYNYIIHKRKEAFASGAAMTPSSRRIYTSLFRDPSVDVYALVNNRRTKLMVGADGITTGSPQDDKRAIFVARAKN